MQSVVARIEREHRTLEELLLRHQEALIERDWRSVRVSFARFAQALLNHLAFKDAEVLTVHALEIVQPRWPTQAYRQEQERLLQLLDRIIDRLAQEPPDDEREERRWVIRVLDDQAVLKNALAQHRKREEKGLLPELLWHFRSDADAWAEDGGDE